MVIDTGDTHRTRHAKAGNTAAVTVWAKRIDQLLDRKNAAAAKETK